MRDIRPLHRPPVDIPEHTPPPIRYTFLLYPREAVRMRARGDIVQRRDDDLVLVVVLGVIVAPVEARVV